MNPTPIQPKGADAAASERRFGNGGVLRNFAWSALDGAGGRLCNFATAIYVARAIGVAGFGRYVLFVSIAQGTTTVSELGTWTYGVRTIARGVERDRHASAIVYTRIAAAGIIAAALVTSAYAIPACRPYRDVLLGAALYAVAYAVNRKWQYAGLGRFGPSTIAALVQGVGLLVATVLLVRAASDLNKAILFYAAAPAVSACLLIVHARQALGFRLQRLPWRDIWQCARQSAIFLGSHACTVLYLTIPLYLIAALAAPRQLGLYSAAQRPVFLAAAILLPAIQAFYPALCHHFQDGPRSSGLQTRFRWAMMAISAPLAILGIIYAPEIIAVLYGAPYAGAVFAMQILFGIVPLTGLRVSYTTPLLAAGRERAVAWASFVSAALIACFVIAGQLLMGIIGAAIGVLLAEAIFCGVAMALARRSLPHDHPKIYVPMAAALAAMLLISLIPGPSLVTAPASLLAYLVAMAAADPLGNEIFTTACKACGAIVGRVQFGR